MYELELLEAGVMDYTRSMDGYSEHTATYLISLYKEIQRGEARFVVTVWNATAERPLIHLGGTRRYVTSYESEAVAYFEKCMKPGVRS